MTTVRLRVHFQGGQNSLFILKEEDFANIKAILASDKIDNFFIDNQWINKYAIITCYPEPEPKEEPKEEQKPECCMATDCGETIIHTE